MRATGRVFRSLSRTTTSSSSPPWEPQISQTVQIYFEELRLNLQSLIESHGNSKFSHGPMLARRLLVGRHWFRTCAEIGLEIHSVFVWTRYRISFRLRIPKRHANSIKPVMHPPQTNYHKRTGWNRRQRTCVCCLVGGFDVVKQG
jgi:hypothetical protein